MEKIIAARHFHLFDSVKEHVNDRLIELEGCTRKLTSARAILDHHKNRFTAEIILHGKKIDIEAKASGEDLLVTFDKAFHKVERQLRKHLDKMQDHHHVSVSELEIQIAREEMNQDPDDDYPLYGT